MLLIRNKVLDIQPYLMLIDIKCILLDDVILLHTRKMYKLYKYTYLLLLTGPICEVANRPLTYEADYIAINVSHGRGIFM